MFDKLVDTPSVFIVSFRGVGSQPRAGGGESTLKNLMSLLIDKPVFKFEGLLALREEKRQDGSLKNTFVHQRLDGQISELIEMPNGLVEAFYQRVNEEDWFEHHPGIEHFAQYSNPNHNNATEHNNSCAALSKYADTIVPVIAKVIRSYAVEESDLVIWVSDYQNWMLLPKLRALFPCARIIYQHNIPAVEKVPDHRLSYYRDIAKAYTDSDIILVFTSKYRDSLVRLISKMIPVQVDLKNQSIITNFGKQHVTRLVDACKTINPDQWAALAADTANDLELPIALQKIMRGGNFAIKADRIADPAKNGPLTFEAIETDFEQTPELVGSFSYVIIGPPNRCEIPVYLRTWEQCERLEKRILDKFPTYKQPPVYWVKQPLSYKALARLYSHAQIQIVNSVADGLHLGAFEGTASRLPCFLEALRRIFFADYLQDKSFTMSLWNKFLKDFQSELPEFVQRQFPADLWNKMLSAAPASEVSATTLLPATPGVLVLSKTAGAWQFLRHGSLTIDAHKKNELINAVASVRCMKIEDRITLNAAALSATWTYTLEHWLDRVTKLLQEVQDKAHSNL